MLVLPKQPDKVDAEIDIGILCVIPLGTHHIPQTEEALLPEC